MTKAIYFDLDGCLVDLYSVPNWLPKLRNEDTIPYKDAQPLVNMQELNALLRTLVTYGFAIGVVSWGSKGGSAKYTRQVKKVKREWVNKYLSGIVSEFHVVKYGTPKQKVVRYNNAILVDDEQQNRNNWQGQTIDASNSEEMMNELRALVQTCYNNSVSKAA